MLAWMMWGRPWLLVAACAAVSTGCSSPAECDRSINKTFEDAVARGIETVPPWKRPGATKMISAMKDVMVKSCRNDRWSQDVIRCLAKIKDESSLSSCAAKLSSEQERSLREAAAAAWSATLPKEVTMGTAGGDPFDEAEIELHDSIRVLVADGMRSHPMTTEIEERLVAAREQAMLAETIRPEWIGALRRGNELSLWNRIVAVVPTLGLTPAPMQRSPPLQTP